MATKKVESTIGAGGLSGIRRPQWKRRSAIYGPGKGREESVARGTDRMDTCLHP